MNSNTQRQKSTTREEPCTWRQEQIKSLGMLYRKLINREAFRCDLASSPFFSSPTNSATELCDQYFTELSQLVDAHAPLRKHVLTIQSSAAWFSSEIDSEKSKRRRFERRWRKSQLHTDRQLFEE